MNSTPQWVTNIAALLTPVIVIAVLAMVIAWRQWRIAQNKLKFDLFDPTTAPGVRLFFQTPSRAIPYLPLAHPSYARNFNMPHHLAHVRAGFANLGVGAPGRQ